MILWLRSSLQSYGWRIGRLYYELCLIYICVCVCVGVLSAKEQNLCTDVKLKALASF